MAGRALKQALLFLALACFTRIDTDVTIGIIPGARCTVESLTHFNVAGPACEEAKSVIPGVLGRQVRNFMRCTGVLLEEEEITSGYNDVLWGGIDGREAEGT